MINLILWIVGSLFFIVLWRFCSLQSIKFLKSSCELYRGMWELKFLFFGALSPLVILTLPVWLFYILKILTIDIMFDYIKQIIVEKFSVVLDKYKSLKKDIW